MISQTSPEREECPSDSAASASLLFTGRLKVRIKWLTLGRIFFRSEISILNA